jgi:hypothetical protein
LLSDGGSTLTYLGTSLYTGPEEKASRGIGCREARDAVEGAGSWGMTCTGGLFFVLEFNLDFLPKQDKRPIANYLLESLEWIF